MDVSENSGTPQIIHFNEISIIFTIHFGVPLFLETPKYVDPPNNRDGHTRPYITI